MSDKKDIQYIYDVSNDFYALFLDKSMSYTCAIFKDLTTSLDQAQINKAKAIETKLGLNTKTKQKVMDIGCGWGNAILYFAKKYPQHQFTGVTLSAEQHSYCQIQIKTNKLKNIEVILSNWQDLTGKGNYDKVFAIGIVEHVTPKRQKKFFLKIRSILKEEGLFLLHGLMDCRIKRKSMFKNTFLRKQIFPNGGVDSIDRAIHRLISANYEVLDVQTFRLDYYLTEKAWYENLIKNKTEAIDLVGEDVYRKFLIYLAGCTASFYSGNAAVAQILCAKENISFKDYLKFKEYQTAWLKG